MGLLDMMPCSGGVLGLDRLFDHAVIGVAGG